jgi:hypothetical protein
VNSANIIHGTDPGHLILGFDSLVDVLICLHLAGQQLHSGIGCIVYLIQMPCSCRNRAFWGTVFAPLALFDANGRRKKPPNASGSLMKIYPFFLFTPTECSTGAFLRMHGNNRKTPETLRFRGILRLDTMVSMIPIYISLSSNQCIDNGSNTA